MALDAEWQRRLDAARMPGKPEVVMLQYPLAVQLMETHQRVLDTLEYLHSQIAGMQEGRKTKVLAAELYNRLSGAYYDPQQHRRTET